MQIQTLLNSSRIMMFENTLEGYDYSVHGTAFLCFYEQGLYAITAAHVIRGFEADALRVMIHPEEEHFLPHNAQVTLVPVDPNDSDYSDLAILPIEQGMFDHSEFRDWPPFQLLDHLVNGAPDGNGSLVFRGFPSDGAGVDYESKTIRGQPVILQGDRVSDSSMAYCHEMRLRDVSPCSTLDGFSGSPVFWISNEDPPNKDYCFSGIVIRGTHSSRIVHYVDGEVLRRALKRLCTS